MTTDGGTTSLRSQATGAVRWTILEKWGGRALTLVVFAILARYVAPSEFGTLSIAMVFLTFINVFVDAGFARALVQRRDVSDLDSTTAFWVSLLLATAAYAIIYVSAPAAAAFYDAPELAGVLRLMGLTVIGTALSAVPAAHMERDFRFQGLSLRVLAGNALGGVAGVVTAVVGLGVWALVTQVLVTQLVSTAVLWGVSKWRPTFAFSFQSLRDMLTFGLSVMGIGLMNAVQSQVDKLVIGIWLGPQALGYYFLAQRFLMVVFELINSVMSRVTLTTFSKVQDEPERLRRGFLDVTFLSALVGVPVFGVVAGFASDLVPIVFGDGWDRSVPLVQIFCATYALACATSFDKNVLLAVGRPKVALAFGLVENLVGLAVLLASAPFGILAVALGRLGYRVAIWPYRMRVLRKHLGVPALAYLRNLGVPFIATIPPALLILLCETTSWSDASPRLLAYTMPMVLAAATLYFGGVLLGSSRDQRATMSATIRTFARRGA